MIDNSSTVQQFNGAADASTAIRPVDFSTGSDTVIRVESLWKEYRLGVVNHGTLKRDLQSWWARVRGHDDPNRRLDVNSSTVQQFNDSTAPEAPDRFWALRDVSFDVRQGEVLGIIGRNGAGKSTLLKILSRVTTPSRGEVKIRGRVASLLEVGTGFHPELTGRENIFLNGAILGMSKAEIRGKLDEIIDFSGVEKFVDTPVKRYSSGMYVRLAFAVAAHLEPEILIIDEVLAVGDAEFQKKCLGKMGEVAKGGRTVLFVSHSIASIRALCTKGLLLDQGRNKLHDAVENVVQKYRAGTEEKANTITWELHSAPGGAEARLCAVRVKQTPASGALLTTYPIDIVMEVWVGRLTEGLNIGFELLTSEGISLLWSHFTDKAREEWPTLRLGQNTLQCTIPPNLLNAGVYHIAPRISIHAHRWIVNIDPPVNFELHLAHGRSPYWTSQSDGKRQGLLTPILDWTSVP